MKREVLLVQSSLEFGVSDVSKPRDSAPEKEKRKDAQHAYPSSFLKTSKYYLVLLS